MTPPSMTQPSTPPLNYGKQERHLAGGRHFDKPRQKFYSRPQQQQQLSANHQMHSNYTHQAGRTPNNVCLLNTPPTSPKKDDAARGRDDERGEEGEDMPAPLAELLSHIPLIEVTNVTPFSAVVQWQPPLLPHFSPPQQYCPDGSHEQPAGGGRNNLGSDEMTVDAGVSYTAADVSYTAADVSYTAADITYEVFVNGHLVGSVTAATSYQLHDLKPGYEYKLQLLCCCAGIRATSLSREVIFVTPTTVPEQPSPPRLFNKSKNSLFVKWVPPKDGGARISSYTLQITEGSAEGEGLWRDAYCGRGRDFTVNNLTPATSYRLRIAAFNLNGPSNWSRELVCSTCGVPPAKPCPPTLLKATVSSLLLSWPRQSPNERYVLKMEDCQNTYGFLVVYRGPDNSYCCSQLRRSSSYNFRLGAESDEGSSPPSDVVCYCTLPEPPGAPSPPSVKGRRSHVLRFTWGPPADTGGAPILSYRLLLDSGNGFEVAYEGTSCECECRDLTPGKTYAAAAQAVSSGGEGHCSKPVMATTEPVVPQQCPPPALAAKPKANVLQLKWDPPAFDGGSIVTEYNVELQQPQGDARLVYSGVSLACTVAGLLPGRPYTLLVRAVNAVGPGPWSEPLQVVSGPAPPEAPRCPQLACRSPTVVCVSWDEPANNGACIEAYNVEVAEVSPSHPESSESSSTCGDSEPTDLTFTHATSSTTTSAEVKHLQPDTSYAMRVCALNAAGLGGFSPHSIVMTPPSAPSAPTHVTATVTCTSINLRWTEPKCNGDPILHYLIDLADAGRSIATAGPVVECTIPDCLPDTQYKLRVQAVNGVGIGPASATFKCHTSRLPPAPPALELLKASHNSLKVSWGEKKQSILKNDQLTYCLQMEFPNPQNQSLEFYQVYCGSGTSYRLTRLDEATPYRLRICASSEAGVGPNSEPVEFRTTWAPPVAPKAPRATERLEEGAVKYEVEWCPVRCHGGTPVTYVLQARIATKQLDYTTVYTGSDTRHVMDVCPGALYNVRVCAVRQLQGGQGTLPGAYSSPTVFNAPDAVQPTRPLSDNTHHRGSAGGRTKLSWQDLTDAQKAALLVTVFSLLAALLAYALAPALHT
ncbi:fibronectin type-III domain-containing protein 3A isoform X2 [Hyalella azteca]|nr:fibronectin type-III domain-containing protein 3A isoform X2 [Hyalella azteca]